MRAQPRPSRDAATPEVESAPAADITLRPGRVVIALLTVAPLYACILAFLGVGFVGGYLLAAGITEAFRCAP